MMITRRLGLLGLLAAALGASCASSSGPSGFDEAVSHDGLQRIRIDGIEFAYARPGATLAGYDRLLIEPVQVAFDRQWDPTRTGSRLRLGTQERENIRRGVATIVQEAFVRELQARSLFKVVDEAGPDVLRVRISIVDLYVNAPDPQSRGRSRTFTVSAGRMTLFAELFDSESGQVLARVVDRRQAREREWVQFTSSVVNRAEAEDIASAWARILRDALDKAHGIGKE